ncbi:glutamine--tRNA ligase/YqeY domain fusion protein [Acidaminobacter sp. JC074]|uniref:glutamine--tRNA ligase/YqeY domain fusion protein n=1 Tax=Acidaminobacter sp. JC074 TaxID=2530199 RepID=UPI001F0E311B|nr:glutamine--tRNA ligase/YqeY domain fusion protein [Acidaminobacter sp. JC074]MCH4889469.1 glutamine--tRNA ligase/YqeY domain fusion protein [Acidaminobacter sp. JC074]
MTEKMMSNFIHNEIDKDLSEKKYEEVHTRFPPEPNGYIHLGHAKAIIINFTTAQKYGGKCNLRFDDTNPIKEDIEYENAIQEDIKWLGYDWDDRLYYASGYFEKLYELAERLIELGKAYVCDLSADEMREQRGDFNRLGENGPYRDRSVEENLDLFRRMRKGEFANGEKVLRAKIDMKHPKVLMRDPVIYRISHVSHHKTGDEWCIYPMYDYAHPLSDALEGISHSLCSKEFEERRELYNWVVREVEYFEHLPRQIEFARLNVTDTVMSKRLLLKLVQDQVVDGWDDPRMPTVRGMKRRGYTASAIRTFVENAGVSKSDSLIDFANLEHFVREDLKPSAQRVMGVLNPLKVVITNYPEGESELLEMDNNQDNPEMGKRMIPFGREIYVEREDFMEVPEKKYFRLFPGNEVRLKGAYFIKCNDFVKDENGEITEIHCTYDPETKSGSGFTGRKVKATLHWVSKEHGVPAEVRLYDSIYKTEEGEMVFNENSLVSKQNCVLEPCLKDAKKEEKFQFYRHGYFCRDNRSDDLVFNLTVSIKAPYKKK